MSNLRKWATPLVVGSFLLMGVSGTLMFFHIEPGLTAVIHEWAGWLMLIGAIAHLVLNWRAFTTYFKKPLANGIMVASASVLAMAMLAPVSGDDHGPGAVFGALAQAPIEKLAALSDHSLEDLQTKFSDLGIDQIRAGDTIGDLSDGDRRTEFQLLLAALSK